ncbi:hypothetical protein CI610_00706 [invertebrate metagenome]|uniref:Uncharacterized protein n=1 Tax=invertebrate metagenome TaxID=1711999 RepID=A0A2H9TAV5_9ZZZZ
MNDSVSVANKKLMQKIRVLFYMVFLCVVVGSQHTLAMVGEEYEEDEEESVLEPKGMPLQAQKKSIIIYSNTDKTSLTLAGSFAEQCMGYGDKHKILFYLEAKGNLKQEELLEGYPYLNTLPLWVIPPKDVREYQRLEPAGKMNRTMGNLYEACWIYLTVEEGKGAERIYSNDILFSKLMLDLQPSHTLLNHEEQRNSLCHAFSNYISDRDGYLLDFQLLKGMSEAVKVHFEGVENEVKRLNDRYAKRPANKTFESLTQRVAEAQTIKKLLGGYERQLMFRKQHGYVSESKL